MSSKNLLSNSVNANRRTLLLAASGLATSLVVNQSTAQAASTKKSLPQLEKKPMYAYVGSRTTKERNARGEGITVFRVLDNGNLEKIQVMDDLVNPSYLTLSADGTRLYTVHGDEMEVSAFSVDRVTGKIAFLNRQSTQGKNPVHLAIDPSGKFLVVTNHIGSSLAVLPIAPDGSLLPLTQLVQLSGPIGPHRIEQKQAKPHFNPFDPSGRFVVVPDKGLDRVFSFQFSNGQLLPAQTPFVTAREGSGPRHMAFHPVKQLAYVVNELDSTVTTYKFDSSNGTLSPLHILSTLPATFTGNSRAAGIFIDRLGKFLYSSNRGNDSITVFKINSETGFPEFTKAVPTLGSTPRFFTLSKDERVLYALNEDSDTIVAFSRDLHNGGLTPTGFSIQTGSPVCMVFSA